MNKHRTAFQDTNKKKPMQQNIDNVLNQCQLKMKQMITKKQEIIKETNLLKGQSKTLEGEIEHMKKYLEEKENEMHTKQEQIEFLQKQIKEKEGEFGSKIKEIRQKEERFKEGLNKVNSELASIQHGTLTEYSKRKAELKQKIEELLAEKEENKNLTERLYNLTHDLSSLEVKYFILFLD
ncbi:MAG: hypothetical protein MJ252_02850 [archaeon]|nr:hypothetical protein [archaeon]